MGEPHAVSGTTTTAHSSTMGSSHFQLHGRGVDDGLLDDWVGGLVGHVEDVS